MRKLGTSEWIAIVVSVVVVGGLVLFGNSFPLLNQSNEALDNNLMTQESENNETNEPASGLQVSDTQVGTGATATVGSTVSVNYRGFLENGTPFDNSYDRGAPFSFTIGAGSVIAGWDQGIPGMKVGGKRTLIIPAELGYGAQAIGPIPPNSTLIFEVELLEVSQ